MLTKIQKWGNSQGIRLPKSLLSSVSMNLDEEIKIFALDGRIIIEPTRKHKSLKERFKNYDGDYQCSEWNTGSPVGREVL